MPRKEKKKRKISITVYVLRKKLTEDLKTVFACDEKQS